MPRLIGISGYAQSGKDTIGSVLKSDHGFERLAFAGPLKAAVYALNPAIGINKQTGNVAYLKPFMDGMTGQWEEKWNEAKKLAEVRRLLQRMGTEVGRNLFGENFWVDQTLFRIQTVPGDYVITDVRFPNEAEAVRTAGGVVVRVHRPGVGPARDSEGRVHISEVSLDGYPHFDYHVFNDGLVSDLPPKIEKILEKI